jgi:hypothetical protein
MTPGKRRLQDACPAAAALFLGSVEPVHQHEKHANKPQNQNNMVNFHEDSP